MVSPQVPSKPQRMVTPDAYTAHTVRGHGALLVVDVETQGFGPYHDRVMQLAARCVTFRITAAGDWEFHDVASFVDYSQTVAISHNLPQAVTRHVDREALRRAKPEVQMMQAWVDFLRGCHADLPADFPTYMVAHNGLVTDAPAIHRALHRAGIRSSDLFTELNLVGLVDTLQLSRSRVPWREWTAPRPATGPERTAEPLAPVAPIPDGDATAPDLKLLHSQGSVHERLFGCTFAGAHDAEHDVSALCDIVRHKLFWTQVVGKEAAVPWGWIASRADHLYSKHLITTRGWRVEACPACVHGPMKPRATEDALSAAFTDGWRVDFVCVARDAECGVEAQSTFPGWVALADGRTREPSGIFGSPGACTCNATCKRGCPCKSAQQTCTAACHPKNRKCANAVATVGPSLTGLLVLAAAL